MINTFRTLFEARERKFQQERLFRGESVDLVAKITTDGVMDTLSGYSISGVYQPTDELSGAIYSVDAEIVDGKAVLHWTNENDFGKDAYNVWGLLAKDGKAAYPICWRLMFAHSPSYPLSTPDPIPRTIDFSQYELLNAPWLPLSGGTLSGRIYYDIEEPVQITNLSSWIGDATGLGRGIITIYNETQNTLDDKYSQEDATLSGRWDNMWNPPNPTGPLVFPENPSEGDVFEPYAAMDGEYLNGKDVTFLKGTVLIANPGWETKEVPCFKIHVVYTYIYHNGEGWVPRSENDWCICKIDGEWQAASFSNGFTAYDSLVWHEFSEGGTEPREPDPFVLSSEIADLATKQYVQEAIASIPTPEVGNFATYAYVDQKFETKVHADETKIELDSKIATKVSKEELSAELSDYATVSFVNDSFNNARTYTDEQIDWLSNVYMKSEDISATYETKQHAADTYHTKADAVADATYLNGRIDAVSAAISSISVEGDYLPLSGGTVTGRIYYGELSDVFTNHQEFYVSEVSATFFFDLELSAERSFLDGTYPYSFEDQNRDGSVRMRIRLDGNPQIYDFGSDVVHIWANLDDQTEEWLGTFSFHTENDYSELGFNGQYPHNDAPSIATFDPNGSGADGIYPAGDPPTMELYVWNTNEGRYEYLTQVSFQKCWDNIHPLNYLTQAGTRDPFVLSSELPVLPEDLVHEDELTAYAQLSDIPDIPEMPEISACLSSDEFISVDFLSVDENKSIALSVVSLTDIGNKINQILVALKRMAIPDPPIDLTKTRVVYTDNSTAELDLSGYVSSSSIPNISNVKAISFGTDVTSLGSTQLTAAWRTLTNVTVPNTITAIPNSFCKAGDSISRGPTALTSLVLPNTIVTIGTESFRACSLTSFTFPANTTSIGNYCFSYSHQLKEVHINAALTSLGNQVFGDTLALSSITVDENNQSFKTENGMLLNKSGTELWKIPPAMSNGNIVVPEGVTKLKFDSCNALSCSSLTLPSTLTTIEQAVFNDSSFTGTNLTIPSSVTSIAFQYWNFPIVFADRTMAQVKAMSRYPWSWSAGAQYICTDGTITR